MNKILFHSRRSRGLARYLLELSLQDLPLCQYPPSLLALAALDLGDEILSTGSRLDGMYTAGHGRQALTRCVEDLRFLADGLIQNSYDLDGVLEKYCNLYECENY